MQASTKEGPRRPKLRRPKIENVEAAEAEKAAAIRMGNVVTKSNLSPSPSPSSSTVSSRTSPPPEHADIHEDTDGALSNSSTLDVDPSNEFSDLRCSSVRTEEIAEREKARQISRKNRCPDYPGLAFGAPLGFGSDTMMKFNIIKNELHNIMRSQLKRVDGEVSALSVRIKEFDSNLEKSEQFIKTATCALAEAVQMEIDRKRQKKENNEDDSDCDENDPLSQFDAQLVLLEGKLMQAKLLTRQDNTTEQPPLINSSLEGDLSSSIVELKLKDGDLSAKETQNSSNGVLCLEPACKSLKGESEELITQESCHSLAYKSDQETIW